MMSCLSGTIISRGPQVQDRAELGKVMGKMWPRIQGSAGIMRSFSPFLCLNEWLIFLHYFGPPQNKIHPVLENTSKQVFIWVKSKKKKKNHFSNVIVKRLLLILV
jgi:hypothetical protein